MPNYLAEQFIIENEQRNKVFHSYEGYKTVSIQIHRTVVKVNILNY